MLNIFERKHKYISNKSDLMSLKLNEGSVITKGKKLKHFPPASQEWYNSVYVYNKNYTKLLPFFNNNVLKLVKSYFNLDEKVNYKNKVSKRSLRLRLKLKRLSTNKIFVSKAQLKHTNSKIILTLYVYNEKERYLLSKLDKSNPVKLLGDKNFLTRIMLIKLQGMNIIKQIREERLLQNQKAVKSIADKYESYQASLYRSFIKRSLRKERLNLKYLRLLYLIRSKLKNSSLSSFSELVNNIYGKKVELNIVNLKYIHLNSDIFLQSIDAKLKNKKNKLLKVLKNSLSLIKLPIFNKSTGTNNTYLLNKMSTVFDEMLYRNKDSLQILIEKMLNVDQNKSVESIQYSVVNSLKYKLINGVRLEASGRLSRRFTAARSVFKFRYKGSLKNIDSSYSKSSSVLLRGHLKSNLQYTKVSSKTRNGSFGLKG